MTIHDHSRIHILHILRILRMVNYLSISHQTVPGSESCNVTCRQKKHEKDVEKHRKTQQRREV